LKIKQFFYGGDNLGYLLYAGTRAVAIDGGAVDEIMAFVRQTGLTLETVTNTHGHGDHTTGTRQLAKAAGAVYLDHRRFHDGDTLFNGTVGNCFSGDLKAFYRSILLLMGYPGNFRVYAGHDYVAASLAFARHLTPDNPAIDAYANRYDRNHVTSTLDDERAVNPYLRFNDPEIIRLLESKGLPTGTEYQRWEGIMSVE